MVGGRVRHLAGLNELNDADRGQLQKAAFAHAVLLTPRLGPVDARSPGTVKTWH